MNNRNNNSLYKKARKYYFAEWRLQPWAYL